MDHSPPGSSVHGILQIRMLEWAAVSSSRGSSQSRITLTSPCSLTQLKCFLCHDTLIPGPHSFIRSLLAMVLKSCSALECSGESQTYPNKTVSGEPMYYEWSQGAYYEAYIWSKEQTGKHIYTILPAYLFWSHASYYIPCPLHNYSSRCLIFPKSLWTPQQVENHMYLYRAHRNKALCFIPSKYSVSTYQMTTEWKK